MSTELHRGPSLPRIVSCLALVLGLCAIPSILRAQLDAQQIGQLSSWLRGPDPVLVVLLTDGVRPATLEGSSWEGPIMPRARQLLDESLVFEDCLSSITQPAAGLRLLLGGEPPIDAIQRRAARGGLAGLIAEGFRMHSLVVPADLHHDRALRRAVPWLLPEGEPPPQPRAGRCVPKKDAGWITHQEQRVHELLQAAAMAEGPQLVVVVLDHFLPPFPLTDDELVPFDPQPWGGSPRYENIEHRVEIRLQRARRVINAEVMPRLGGKQAGQLDLQWVMDAMHARFDRFLGSLLDRLARPDLSERAALIWTATSASAIGERSAVGSADGVELDVCRVPMIWKLPVSMSVRQRIHQPCVTADLGPTLQALLSDDASTKSLPLFHDRLRPGRLVVGWGQRTLPRASFAFHELRWTTDGFSLLQRRTSRSSLELYDRWLDPEEFDDRAPQLRAVAESLAAELRLMLLGPEPELWIAMIDVAGVPLEIKTPTNPEIIEADGLQLHSRSAPRTVEFESSQEIAWLRMRARGVDELATLRIPSSARTVPLYGGRHAPATSGSTLELACYGPEFLQTLIRREQAERLRAHPDPLGPGVHVWIIADGLLQPGN